MLNHQAAVCDRTVERCDGALLVDLDAGKWRLEYISQRRSRRSVEDGRTIFIFDDGSTKKSWNDVPRYICRAAIVFGKLVIVDVGRVNIRYNAGIVSSGVENERIILETDVADDRGIENIDIDRIGKKDKDSKQRSQLRQIRSHTRQTFELARVPSESYMPK